MLAGAVPVAGSQISSSGRLYWARLKRLNVSHLNWSWARSPKGNALGDTEVSLPQAWAAYNVARGVAVAVRIGYCGKCIRVDPIFGRSTDRFSAGRGERNSGNQIRPGVGCVAGRDGRTGARVSDVERGAGTRCDDIGQAPPAENRAGDSRLRKECLSGAEGKFIDDVGIDDMARVEVS